MSDEAAVSVYRSDPPLEPIFDVRRRVFVEGQDVPESEEIDGKDEEAVQFLARAAGDPVGTARLRSPQRGIGKVERVAVLEDRREDGWGRKIMEAVESVAREDGLEKLVLHGQVAVEGFYESLGYERTSEVYMEVGIPHVTMEKRL